MKTKPSKNNNPLSEREELKFLRKELKFRNEENEYLKAENAILKKLDALSKAKKIALLKAKKQS